jgi:hypothetical protein
VKHPKLDLWPSESIDRWSESLARYESIVAQQGVEGLAELDRWWRAELPAAISGRARPHITHDELVRVTRWKMARGVWRARNLVLVQGNAPATVMDVSRAALAGVPDSKAPVAALAKLAGVGPATASAVLAAAAPEVYPFFDELVAAQVPTLEKVAYTLPYYFRYAAALRERARQLGGEWTPSKVEQALWSHAGGKAGARLADR